MTQQAFYARAYLPKRMGMTRDMMRTARSFAQDGGCILIVRATKPNLKVHMIDGKVCWTKLPKPTPPKGVIIVDDVL